MLYKFRENKRIELPNDRGITGRAFQTGQLFHTNKMLHQRLYMEDIDNLSACKDVRNLMIGPVYAHSEPLSQTQIPDPIIFDRQKPIGVIQLINKCNYESITEFDV